MRRRDMIAFKVIIDINFPITVDDVVSPLEVFEFSEIAPKFRHIFRNVAQNLAKTGSLGIEVHEYERSPCFRSKAGQRYGCSIPVFDSLKLRLAQEPAIQRIGPPMIRAAQRGAVALTASDCARAVPAN